MLIGHKQVWEYLLNAFAKRQPSHAYLLLGPEHVGKTTLIKTLLQQIFCESGYVCGECASCQQIAAQQHPDLWWVERLADKQDITIQQVRELQQFTMLSSLTGAWRIVVINGADNLNEQSANALLKSLEEPRPRVVYFIIASEPRRLLPTIISRCQVLQLGLVSYADIRAQLTAGGATEAAADEIAHLAQGLPGLALILQQNPSQITRQYEQADLFWGLLGGSSFGDFVSYVENDIKDTTEGEGAARRAALALLACWRRLTRDIFLTKFGLYEQITFLKYRSRFTSAARLSSAKLLAINQTLQAAGERLQRNAHIKLTLEAAAYALTLLASEQDFKVGA